ncbi:MAG: hypothetical protein ABF290_17105 [Thiogranum sp.]
MTEPTKTANDNWEYKRTVPWHDDQMCVVNGYHRVYFGAWGPDALVYFRGDRDGEGGKSTVAVLQSRPDRYKLIPPTLPRTAW